MPETLTLFETALMEATKTLLQ